ncbi:MAG TPA: DUF4412 domain-containing protein [Thermoanaerobaculia bacterium]|jgi:hypothetical protein|nr:DUF4412 domain-containing protein [Thermoanaerobaculia bacterium]
MKFRRTVLWTLLAASLPAALSASTVITLKEQSTGGSSDDKIYLDGGKLRVESAAGGHSHVILYHATNGSLQVLDPVKKTWFELPGGATGAEQQAAIAKLVKERKDLSDLQKQQILNNMKDNADRHGLYGGTGPSPAEYKAEYRKVASGVKVNGYTTDQYEVLREGRKVREVWLADPQSLGIDPADVAAFRSLGERLGARQPPGRPSGFTWEAGAPEGVPVRTVTYVKGQPSTTTDISAVSHENVAASLFEVPKEYAQTKIGAPGH